MTWHILKRFDGEWSGWHLCSECFDEWRLKTVQAAVQSNAHVQDAQYLIDPARWYEATEADIAGTRLWELSCYGCGEYWPNDAVLRDDPEEVREEAIAELIPAEPQPTVRYFANMPPMDPDEKPKTVKKKKVSSTSTWDVMFRQAMDAAEARIVADPGPDF